MKKSEKAAVVRLVRYMKQLQTQVANPEVSDATDEEVLKLFELLWEWTPTPRHKLPSKHVIENLVGLMRGCQPRDYCYISRGDVSRIIRKEANNRDTSRPLSVCLNEDADLMTDNELYDNGRWNYKETGLVDLLWNMHCNPQLLSR